MKKPIILLTMLALMILPAGCGGSQPAEEAATEAKPVPPLTAEEVERVQVLVEENICAECHSENREGSETGPSLLHVGEHWTEERLAQYVNNPELYMASHPEMRERNPGFTIDMPPYTDLPEEDRRLLVRWALQQSE